MNGPSRALLPIQSSMLSLVSLRWSESGCSPITNSGYMLGKTFAFLSSDPSQCFFGEVGGVGAEQGAVRQIKPGASTKNAAAPVRLPPSVKPNNDLDVAAADIECHRRAYTDYPFQRLST